MTAMRTALCSSALALALLIGVPAPGGALAQQEAPAPAGKAASSETPDSAETAERLLPPVSFTVSVVFARKEQGTVDTRVLHLVNRLPMKFGSVQVVEQKALSVRFGEEARLPLSTGGELRLLPVLVHQNQLHMHFQMPHVVDTRLKMSNGRPVILGGVPYEDGYLIIEVKPDFAAYLTPQNAPAQPALPQTFSVGHPQRAPQD